VIQDSTRNFEIQRTRITLDGYSKSCLYQLRISFAPATAIRNVQWRRFEKAKRPEWPLYERTLIFRLHQAAKSQRRHVVGMCVVATRQSLAFLGNKFRFLCSSFNRWHFSIKNLTKIATKLEITSKISTILLLKKQLHSRNSLNN